MAQCERTIDTIAVVGSENPEICFQKYTIIIIITVQSKKNFKFHF